MKKASGDGATLDEMKKKIGDELAPKYEAGMSKYPLGQYRDRIGQNVEMVYKRSSRRPELDEVGAGRPPPRPVAYFSRSVSSGTTHSG